MGIFFENFDPIAGVARPLNENTAPPAGGGSSPPQGGSNYRFYQGIDYSGNEPKWKQGYVLYIPGTAPTPFQNEYGQNTPTDFGTPSQLQPEKEFDPVYGTPGNVDQLFRDYLEFEDWLIDNGVNLIQPGVDWLYQQLNPNVTDPTKYDVDQWGVRRPKKRQRLQLTPSGEPPFDPYWGPSPLQRIKHKHNEII